MKIHYRPDEFLDHRGRRHPDGIYYAEATYWEKGNLKAAGFWWDPKKKRWWTPRADVALQLAENCTDSCRAKLMTACQASSQGGEIKVTWDGTWFVAECPYDDRDVVKLAGFRWNEPRSHWRTKDPARASHLREFLDAKALERITWAANEREELWALSRAIDSDAVIPAPHGQEYMPFQRAGIAFAQRVHNCLIADEMGLGKTIQALGLINASPGMRNILVICPNVVKINWQREANRWLTDPLLEIGIAEGAYVPQANALLYTGRLVIANYEMIFQRGATRKQDTDEEAEARAKLRGKLKPAFAKQEWDLVICDECHYLKSQSSLRTKAVRQLKAKRRLYLTGTPIVNRPVELWPIIHDLNPSAWGTKADFTERFCDAQDGQFGRDTSGNSNLDELQRLLRSTLMVRRLKKDVLTDLPPKRRQLIVMEAPEGVIEREQEQMTEQLQRTLARWRKRTLGEDLDPDGYQQALNSIGEDGELDLDLGSSSDSKSYMNDIAEISRIRHETARAKVPDLILHLEESIESCGKVVCWLWHRDVIEAVVDHFGPRCRHIYGGMSAEQRQANVDLFQESGPAGATCQLFVGSIKAAGVGITLTAASHVVVGELPWTPGDLSQAEDRCHRIGQASSVTVQHLVLDNSIDLEIAQLLVDKQDIIDQALDRQANPEVVTTSGGPNA